VDEPRVMEEAKHGALERAEGEVVGMVGGVDEVHGVRVKLAAATACSEDR
jgi:hypothetical protein